MDNKARVHVIAGSNGAGKTTFAKVFLPEIAGTVEFINADLIAQKLSPSDPNATALRAGRLVLERINELSCKHQNFTFETTLSGKIYRHIFQKLRTNGYSIHLFYLWIPSPELGVERIKERVAQGGHSVPARDVQRRFSKSIINLFQIYEPLADTVTIFDNSRQEPQLIAEKKRMHWTVVNDNLFQYIKDVSKP